MERVGDAGADRPHVEAGGHDRRPLPQPERSRGHPRICLTHPNARDEPRAKDFRERSGAALDERVGAAQQIVSRPVFGQPAGQREFLRRTRARDRDPRVDAADECAGDGPGVGSVARPVGVDVSAILDAPRHDVALDEIRAEHLRQPALDGAAPEIHLKQPILRLDEPLREEQIVLVLRGDVRYAPAVADDRDWRGQPFHRESSRHLRGRPQDGPSRSLAMAGPERHGDTE